MSKEDGGKESGSRKWKVTFPIKEPELVTEECVDHLDQLCGKASLTVPESQKTKILNSILEKVNSLGVTQRTIPEIHKWWSDPRSGTKEKVASRIPVCHRTGGGPSKHTLPLPWRRSLRGHCNWKLCGECLTLTPLMLQAPARVSQLPFTYLMFVIPHINHHSKSDFNEMLAQP